MLATINSAALFGIDAIPVSVEVDVANGLPSFTTVGLPDSSVRESKDRVKAAIKNCGYEFPGRKITVNLAPADLKKEGPSFDLPIALGLLATTGIIEAGALSGYLAVGELSLDGTLRPVSGVLSIALTAAHQQKSGLNRGLIVPADNGAEAQLAENIEIVAVHSLPEIVEILNGVRQARPVPATVQSSDAQTYPVGFEDIRGQNHVKRALEIGVAGMHNVLLQGPPGSGKTLIARSLPSIMPDWSPQERLETTRLYSVSGKAKNTVLRHRRPFRAPHHTISDGGLIGGGAVPQPGEVSLAHNGVLFLDELPEFKRHVLEVLRQPLEDGMVTISRAQMSLSFPARFMLVAAMNPCPCGFLGDKKNSCQCNEAQIQRYRSRISGPLLDRIDMHLEVEALDFSKLQGNTEHETSEKIRARVQQARQIQRARFGSSEGLQVNGRMGVKHIERFCSIDASCRALLEKCVDRLGLSARAYHRILKLARTIADLGGSDAIQTNHVAEAVQYRRGEFQG
jgi:magnesium chelatase family protein